MTDDQILYRVGEIVAETVGLATLALTPATTAADVEGWDSLANVQIIVAIEKRFGIRFRTGEIASIKSVGELVARIASRLSGPRNG
ncbi:MAG TPA: acyl carrier protein [Vicinamibacterales bacterium]|nr:acyl carrier protein [Vicinamibacterales bacterium]